MDFSRIPSQVYEATISVEELSANAVNVPLFAECCKLCPKYGHSWACPPFSFDVAELWGKYKQVFLCVAKCDMPKELLSISYPQQELNELCEAVCAPLAKEVLLRLRQFSAKHGGSRIMSPDGCHRCEDTGCSRKEGLPCRYPEEMTLSVEGLGLDAQWTLKHCFNMELQWGEKGHPAPYYIRMGGVLIP